MTRLQYLRQAASLRRTGHKELAGQFMNLPYVEAPPIAPGHDGGERA